MGSIPAPPTLWFYFYQLIEGNLLYVPCKTQNVLQAAQYQLTIINMLLREIRFSSLCLHQSANQSTLTNFEQTFLSCRFSYDFDIATRRNWFFRTSSCHLIYLKSSSSPSCPLKGSYSLYNVSDEKLVDKWTNFLNKSAQVDHFSQKCWNSYGLPPHSVPALLWAAWSRPSASALGADLSFISCA